MKHFEYFFIAILFISTSLITFNSQPAEQKVITTKLTAKRLLRNPTKYLSQFMNRVQLTQGFSDIDEHRGKESINECTSDFNNVRDIWNEFLSCTFIQLVEIYNDFTGQLALFINPDNDFSVDIGEGFRIVSTSSSVAGYNREVLVTKNDTQICLSLHYSKRSDDPKKFKMIMHLNSITCPFDDNNETESHAIAMIVDLHFSDSNIQRADFFHTGNAGGDFDITVVGSPEGNDQMFFERVVIDSSSETPKTTVHALFLSEGKAMKVAVNGEDDVKLLISSNFPLLSGLTDSALNQSGVLSVCLDDAQGGFTTGCDAFVDFPLAPVDLKDLVFPVWTTSNFSVEANAPITDYFVAD